MDSPSTSARIRGGVWRWWHGREWRPLLFGLPAVLVGSSVAALAAASLNTPAREVHNRYAAEGKAALAGKNFARARTCFERFAPTSADDPDAVYRLAMAAEGLGDTARAAALLRELAPADRKGYGPAHFWWARKLLAVAPSRQVLAAAENHLVRALDGELEDRPAAHGLLGHLYQSQEGRLDDAEFHLTKAVATKPQFRLSLARLHLQRRNPGRARQEAELVARFYRERAKNDLNNHEARLAWADATTFLEEFPAAVKILDDGLESTGLGVYRVALGRVYAAWADARARQTPAAGEVLALLDKGLTHDPSNRDLLDRLVVELRAGGPAADQARAGLKKLLAAEKTATAAVHLVLAADATHRKDAAEAKLHLELALKLDPKTPTVANNLAWVLSQPPHADLPRALAVASVAVELNPTNPVYLDTRGHILLALGLWKDAVVDLEGVLARSPKSPGLRAALAEAYDKLGQPEVAAEHRRLATEQAAAPLPTPARP